jgi:hypothetical protein
MPLPEQVLINAVGDCVVLVMMLCFISVYSNIIHLFMDDEMNAAITKSAELLPRVNAGTMLRIVPAINIPLHNYSRMYVALWKAVPCASAIRVKLPYAMPSCTHILNATSDTLQHLLDADAARMQYAQIAKTLKLLALHTAALPRAHKKTPTQCFHALVTADLIANIPDVLAISEKELVKCHERLLFIWFHVAQIKKALRICTMSATCKAHSQHVVGTSRHALRQFLYERSQCQAGQKMLTLSERQLLSSVGVLQ